MMTMSPRLLLALALALSACHGGRGPAPIAARAQPTSKLGPDTTEKEIDARLADHRLRIPEVTRLPDEGGSVTPTTDIEGVKVKGSVLAVLSCRPDGESAQVLADARYLYIRFIRTPATLSFDRNGRQMMTEPTYCSYIQFRIPDGLEYGGVVGGRAGYSTLPSTTR